MLGAYDLQDFLAISFEELLAQQGKLPSAVGERLAVLHGDGCAVFLAIECEHPMTPLLVLPEGCSSGSPQDADALVDLMPTDLSRDDPNGGRARIVPDTLGEAENLFPVHVHDELYKPLRVLPEGEGVGVLWLLPEDFEAGVSSPDSGKLLNLRATGNLDEVTLIVILLFVPGHRVLDDDVALATMNCFSWHCVPFLYSGASRPYPASRRGV